MSIDVMALVSKRFPEGGSALIAMLALADWCNDDGGSLFPSVGHLAARMRVSESQARRVLHDLIDAGYVAVVGNVYGGAPGATRNYRLNVERLRALPILPAIAMHIDRTRSPHRNRSHVGDDIGETARMGDTPSADATPRTDAHDGSHGCAGRVAPMRETGRMGASLTTNNQQGTVREPSRIAHEKVADEQFEQAWAAYPKRVGGNSKGEALKKWKARLSAGERAEDMLDGTLRYAKFCDATGKTGTEFVKMATTFYGPARHFAEAWEPPAKPPQRTPSDIGPTNSREASRAAAAASIGLGAPNHDDEHLTIDGEFKRIA